MTAEWTLTDTHHRLADPWSTTCGAEVGVLVQAPDGAPAEDVCATCEAKDREIEAVDPLADKDLRDYSGRTAYRDTEHTYYDRYLRRYT